MVEISVAVPDPSLAQPLMRRLGGLFDPSLVTYDRTRNQVRVCAEWESRAADAVLDAVRAWMKEAGAPMIELAVGDRSYKLVP